MKFTFFFHTWHKVIRPERFVWILVAKSRTIFAYSYCTVYQKLDLFPLIIGFIFRIVMRALFEC